MEGTGKQLRCDVSPSQSRSTVSLYSKALLIGPPRATSAVQTSPRHSSSGASQCVVKTQTSDNYPPFTVHMLPRLLECGTQISAADIQHHGPSTDHSVLMFRGDQINLRGKMGLLDVGCDRMQHKIIKPAADISTTFV